MEHRESGWARFDGGGDGFRRLAGVHGHEDAAVLVIGDERARRLGERQKRCLMTSAVSPLRPSWPARAGPQQVPGRDMPQDCSHVLVNAPAPAALDLTDDRFPEGGNGHDHPGETADETPADRRIAGAPAPGPPAVIGSGTSFPQPPPGCLDFGLRCGAVGPSGARNRLTRF